MFIIYAYKEEDEDGFEGGTLMADIDYPGIRQWHKESGSHSDYILNLVEQARRDNAPQDAIYRTFTRGTWQTVRDLRPDHEFRVWFEAEYPDLIVAVA